MSKQNDLMLNILGNPLFTTEDFLKVGLSADNTSLEDEDTYLKSTKITENPLFLNEYGEFDKNKFHSVYIGASNMLLSMATKTLPLTIYSKYNIFAPVSLRDLSPQFELVKNANPDRITRSMITLGRAGEKEYTPSEIAQSLKILNSETGEWMDSPEDLFSIKKLFSDFTGFFSDNFGSNKVLAQYEEDEDVNGLQRGQYGFDENNILHQKGEYKLNENGTYYYRTLKDGENIYGKLLLHYSDILTREGSALNSIDFLDSDDILKSPFGSFVKNASLIGAMFIPGGVGTAIAGATIFLLAVGLGATLGKIALGSDSPTMNWIEGLVESTNPMNTRSEYSSGDKMWTTENLLGMVGDVVGQLKLQRLLFQWAPMITKGKWGIDEKTLAALKEKYIQEIASKNKNSLEKIVAKYGPKSKEAQKASAELIARDLMEAAAMVENYMKDYYKAGEEISKAYMTLLTVNDIYGEAKEAGATDFDSALITAGYAAMEYALLSTDIGKWVLPELRANRIENKAIVKALTKDTLETFKKLGAEAATNETAKRTYIQRLVDFGKSIAKGEFNAGLGKRAAFKDGEGLLKAGFGSVFAGATAEAVEETSEEVLADFSRVLFNGLQSLKGSDVRLKAPWEDDHLFDRYTMSFLGGFLGGGISSAAMDFSQARKAASMNYNQAVQQLIWKARNNDLDGVYKLLNTETIGNKNLSSTKFVEDEEGNRIWKLGTETDNLDLAIKTIAKRQIQLLLDTLEAHGGNMSDLSLLDALTLKDLRYRVLHDSTTAGMYILKYNKLLSDLIDTTLELKNMDSAAEKMEKGESDKKERTEGLSATDKLKRKKLEEKLKSIDELLDNFKTGKLAPLFMTSALLESTPFISEVFMRSSFRTFAEDKAKTKFENIPEGELKLYLNEYQNHLRTSKKDDIELATEGYLALANIIGGNFQEAVEVSKAMLLDLEIKQLLSNSNLASFVQANSDMDEDSWLEAFLEYINNNPWTKPFITSILLLRNTSKENHKALEDTYNQNLVSYKEKLDSGEWDEELYNNSVQMLTSEFEQNKLDITSETENSIGKLNLEVFLNLASNLADKFINLGYINGAIKDLVISKLNELVETANKHINDILAPLGSRGNDEALDDMIKYQDLVSVLLLKIEQIKNLKYTPILLNIDKFALNLNGTNVSKVLQELANAIETNKSNISAFTFGDDIHHAINEADRVLDLYIAALEGARTDTVDPFDPEKTNLWGINKTINDIHRAAPKIENDTWIDLPEIEGDIANMMLMDARSIKNLLLSYKRLFDINRGQKLELLSRVGTRTTYLLYDRVRRLLANEDFPKTWNGVDKLNLVFDNLQFLKEQTEGKEKKDWKISLNIEDLIKLEKEKLAMEDAIYEFFNTDNPEANLEEFFNHLLFKVGNRNTSLLTENAEDIDESSIIGYLAAKIAIKSSDFYAKYKDLLKEGDKKIAPLLGLEIGILLNLANILNGTLITKVIKAYRNSLYNHLKSLDFKSRVDFFMKETGASKKEALFYSTQTGFNKFFASHDLVIQYGNITFVDGVPGSGKTLAICGLTVKYLLKYNQRALENVWTIHGGGLEYALKYRTDVGLSEDSSKTFDRDGLMDKITPDRGTPKLSNEGNSYEFEENKDYKLQNGKVVPTWKLNSFTKEELPTVIFIDEAQQFTLLELLTIDKFARENGIPVVMSGDLLQSLMDGIIKLSKTDIDSINAELRANGEAPFDDKELDLTLKLGRNSVLHTPKPGTSMRTENNQLNENMAMMLALMEIGGGEANFRYFENDTDIAGSRPLLPSETDELKRLLDKIIPNLKEDEKINFAYTDETSPIYQLLKSESKYWNNINPIKGTALGLEGNYWILDIRPGRTVKVKNGEGNEEEVTVPKPIDSYLQDLYTGITRAKKASIIISDKTPNVKQEDGTLALTINGILDKESHPEKYSEKSIEKSIDKRVQVLEGALPKDTSDIDYYPRNPQNGPTPEPTPNSPTGPVVPPVNPQPVVPPSGSELTFPTVTLGSEMSMELLSKELVDNHLVNIPAKGLTTGTLYEVPMIDFYHRKIVLIDINGMKIPFYLSTGLGGKENVESGKWYPIWGIDPQEGWLNKTNESEINNFYGSLLLKSIANALDEKYKDTLPDDIPLTDADYDPMYNTINQTTGFSTKAEGSKGVRDRYNSIIPKLNESIGFIEEEEIPEIEEITKEEIIEEDVSNEKETLKLLSEQNVDNNSEGIESHSVSGLSKKDFNFFLFSNATFELGITQNDDGSFNLGNLKRIDGFNGLSKLMSIPDILTGINKLAEIRDLLMSVEDKSELEGYLAESLGLEGVYVTYGIKTSELKDDGSHGDFDKLERDSREELPYARAQIDPNSESNHINYRNLVAIIGTESDGDVLELPLLTLNNPITIICSKDYNQQYRYPEVFNIYNTAYTQAKIDGANNGQAKTEGLKAVLNTYKGNSDYEGLTNLITEYIATDRHISFIDDPKWTIGKNLHSFGPLLNIKRAHNLNPDYNPDYVLEDRWIKLSELRKDPQLKISGVMHYSDKTGKYEDEETGELITVVNNPKHPFVLYTDSSVDHDGNPISGSDEELVKEYLYLKFHPEVKQTIKLVYVLPPKYNLKNYMDSLIDFMVKGGKFILGNQRTPFKILENLLLDSNGNSYSDTIELFKTTMGNETGLKVYDKVLNIVTNLRTKPVLSQITELFKAESWDIDGFGIKKDISLYKQLLNVLKQLVYPTAVTITGQIYHKGSNRFEELFPKMNEIFSRNNVDLFFLTRGSKDSSKIISGRFSPIQDVDENGILKNDYIEDGEFYINGNLSTSTFMADEAFNEIMALSVSKLYRNDSGLLLTKDTLSYINGKSKLTTTRRSFTPTNIPSIHPEILGKLIKFGITSSKDLNDLATLPNDNSTELKQKIADIINSKNLELKALVLPNGELLLGKNILFKDKEVKFNLGEKPFESGQNYMFEVSINGKIYDAILSKTDEGNNLELTERSEGITYNFGNYSPTSIDSVLTARLNFIELLLNIIDNYNIIPIQNKIKNILELPEDFIDLAIVDFINSPMTKAIFRKLQELNFDFNQFTNILEFEQEQKTQCNSININLI